MRARRGSTLAEVMTVVAIIGILSAMGGSALQGMLAFNRVAASGKGLNSALGGVRTRAAASNCAHFVQVNGPTFAGVGSTSFPVRAGTISMMRKGNCASTVTSFEPGDRLVDSVQLGPDEIPTSVQLALPKALLPGGTLGSESFVIGYDRLGSRRVWFDASGTGEAGYTEVLGLGTADLYFAVHERTTTTPLHILAVVAPAAGSARLQWLTWQEWLALP